MGWFQKKKKKGAPIPMHALQTERLVLRGFDITDAIDVFAYSKNPKVGMMAGWAPHKTLEDSRTVVRGFIEKGEVWAVVEKKSGRVIGAVGLHKNSGRAFKTALSLGYAFGEDWWGQGYGTEAAGAALRYAFETLECPIVSCDHFPENERSKRVIEKLGFRYEGEIRQAVLMPDGTTRNSVCYSMTREEAPSGL